MPPPYDFATIGFDDRRYPQADSIVKHWLSSHEGIGYMQAGRWVLTAMCPTPDGDYGQCHAILAFGREVPPPHFTN